VIKELNTVTSKDLIHYKYVGGGYYRDSRVPKGAIAPMLHGDEVIRIFREIRESKNL